MTRASLRLILPLIALMVPVAADAQDLWMSNSLDTLTKMSVYAPAFTPDTIPATTLVATAPSTAYLAVWNFNGVQVPGRCSLIDGDTVQLLKGGSPYLSVVYSATAVKLTVSSSPNTFSQNFAPPAGEVEWNLNYADPGTDFRVLRGGNPIACGSLSTTSFDGAALRISSDARDGPKPTGPSDDPPIPMSMYGGSFQIKSPRSTSVFSCSGNTATMTNFTKAVAITKFFQFPAGSETYIDLTGISDWRIIAYPQQLEITPGFWGGTLKFRAPSATSLTCGDGKSLVVDTGSKPQSFVVDWSPGWFRSRRSVQVQCQSPGCRVDLTMLSK